MEISYGQNLRCFLGIGTNTLLLILFYYYFFYRIVAIVFLQPLNTRIKSQLKNIKNSTLKEFY